MNTTETSASAPRPPKAALFGSIHKALRLALTEVLALLGATSFDDEESAAAAASRLRAVLDFCTSHIHHEDRWVRPAVAERLPGGSVGPFEAHAEHTRAIAELRALIDAVLAAHGADRPRIGHALYLHASRFVAENLSHMADEEQVLQPLLERFFTDAELQAIHGQILAATTPEERALAFPYMFRACSQSERRALVAGMAHAQPREVSRRIVESLRGALADADVAELLAIASGGEGGAS